MAQIFAGKLVWGKRKKEQGKRALSLDLLHALSHPDTVGSLMEVWLWVMRNQKVVAIRLGLVMLLLQKQLFPGKTTEQMHRHPERPYRTVVGKKSPAGSLTLETAFQNWG
jgi:hypothetical protein